MTNADKVRQMSDEELAEWLWSACCRISKNPCPEGKFVALKRTFLAWVKKEAK